MDVRYRDKEWLQDKYTVEGWSTTDIGKFCGTSHQTIGKWLIKHCIPARDAQACQLTKSKKIKREIAKGYMQKDKQPIQVVEDKPILKWS